MNSVWQTPTTTSSVGSVGVPLLFCTIRAQTWSGPQSLLNVQTEEQKVRLVPPGDLEVAVVAGAAQALSRLGAGRARPASVPPVALQTVSDGARPRRTHPCPVGQAPSCVQAVAAIFDDGVHMPDLRLRAVGRLRRRVLEAARRGRAVGVVAAHRGAERLGAGNRRWRCRASRSRSASPLPGWPSTARRRPAPPTVGATQSSWKASPVGDRLADDADAPAVAERVGARLAVACGLAARAPPSAACRRS